MSLLVEHLRNQYVAYKSWNRAVVLKRLRERYPVLVKKAPEGLVPLLKKQPVSADNFVQSVPLYLRDREHFAEYMAKVKHIDPILQVLRENTMGKEYIKYIENYRERVSKVLDKTKEFDEETTENVVDTILGLIRKYLVNFIIGAYRGMRGSEEESRAFYGRLHRAIEAYLEQIYVKAHPVREGRSIREMEVVNDDRKVELIEIFKILKKETQEEQWFNIIDEIELQPHFVTYIDGDDECELAFLEGQCVVWGKKN